jgi:hypothetical protein
MTRKVRCIPRPQMWQFYWEDKDGNEIILDSKMCSLPVRTKFAKRLKKLSGEQLVSCIGWRVI